MLHLYRNIDFINKELSSTKWAVGLSLSMINNKSEATPEELTQVLIDKEAGAKLLLANLYWWLGILQKELQGNGVQTPVFIYQVSRELCRMRGYYQLWKNNPELPFLKEITSLLEYALPENEIAGPTDISIKMKEYSEWKLSKADFTAYINDLMWITEGLLLGKKTNTTIN